MEIRSSFHLRNGGWRAPCEFEQSYMQSDCASNTTAILYNEFFVLLTTYLVFVATLTATYKNNPFKGQFPLFANT